MKLFANFKLRTEIKYILTLFISTRIILTIIGIMARIWLGEPTLHNMRPYTNYSWLNIWGVWDTVWYLKISDELYPSSFNPNTYSSWAFFPLYPLLIRILGKIVGDNFIAGIIISNASLLIAAYFLYKLVRLESDENTSFNAIKYLFLFPTSFVLSGVLTESLFICLAIACFYYGKKQNWLIAGMLGFFLSLTKSLGVLIVIPLAYEYFKGIDFNIRKIKIDVVFLLLIPLGMAVFSAYGAHLTGEHMAFVQAQKAWGKHLADPTAVLIKALHSTDVVKFVSGISALIGLIVLTVFYKKIGFSYWLLGIFFILVPLSAGKPDSLPRYLTVVFPLHIIFSRLSENRYYDQGLTATSAILQGFLMACWTAAFRIMM